MNTEGLKVGDKVLRVARGGTWAPDRYFEAIITHVWPSGRVGVGTMTFNANGRERGREPYCGGWLELFDQSKLDIQTHRELVQKKRNYLDDVNWRRGSLSDQTILRIAAEVERELAAQAPQAG